MSDLEISICEHFFVTNQKIAILTNGTKNNFLIK